MATKKEVKAPANIKEAIAMLEELKELVQDIKSTSEAKAKAKSKTEVNAEPEQEDGLFSINASIPFTNGFFDPTKADIKFSSDGVPVKDIVHGLVAVVSSILLEIAAKKHRPDGLSPSDKIEHLYNIFNRSMKLSKDTSLDIVEEF